MIKLQDILIQWFPLMICLSLMLQPHLLHFSAFSMTAIPLLFLFWLLLIHHKTGIFVPKLGLIAVCLLVFGQLILSLFGGVKEEGVMLVGLVWVMTALILYGAMQHMCKYIDILMYSYIAASVLWAIVAAIVWLGFTDGDAISFGGLAVTHMAQPKPTGPFSNGNVFGIMMLCAWILSLKYGLTKHRFSVFMLCLAFFFLTWVVASLSRGAWLAGSIVYFAIMIRLLQAKRWSDLWIMFLMLVGAWWLAAQMIAMVDINLTLAGRAEQVVNIDSARLVLYPAVFEVWKEHWFFGVGLGNLTGHFLTGQAKALSYLPQNLHGLGATSSAHNHFLYMLSTTGIMGMLVWLVPSFVLFKSIFSNRLDLASQAWAPLAVALVLWVQGLFNISMNEALPFFSFILFLGLGVALEKKCGQQAWLKLPQRFSSFVMGIVMVGLIFASYQTIQAWTLYEKIATAQVTGPERGETYGKLFRLNYDRIYPYTFGSVVMDFVLMNPEDRQAWESIQPNIKKALALEEWPKLYQALFYSYILQENWDEACTLGMFLKQQRWENDKNITAYNKACLGEKADDFVIGW